MIVTLRTLEVLGIFSLLGLPLTWLLLPRRSGPRPRLQASMRLLLAPTTGLAFFAVYTATFYATLHPVAAAVHAFWPVVATVWLIGAAVWWRGRPPQDRRPFHLNANGAGLIAHGLVLLGLIPVLVAFLWPFWQQPDLVFWHYAGSDGYMYMRIAEHVASPGMGVMPSIGAYDAASGFLTEGMRHFQAGTFVDKPGTMSTLAGMAGVLGLTTHEAFSPLIVAGVALLYLVLVAFGQSLLKLPVWASTVFALLGALCPSVWMLGTHTFLGNVLALSLFPLLMLLVRPTPRWPAALLAGLLLGAFVELFPDGVLALAGMLGLAGLHALWVAYRRHRLGRWLAVGGLALATAAALITPFGLKLYATAAVRLASTVTADPISLFQTQAAATSAAAVTAGKSAAKLSWNWIWPALNVNTLPPEALRAGEVPFLLGFLGLLALFIVASCWRRERVPLLCYLASFLMLPGLARVFHSDYELFRAMAVFAFVPLGALCTVPWQLAGPSLRRQALVLRLALIAGLVPLLDHFLRVDQQLFQFGYGQHMSDAEYTTGNLRDRTAIAQLSRSNSLVLTSEIPTFTALANTIMLFSQAKLGTPESFHKFVFFTDDIGRPDRPYESEFVIHSLRYLDITKRIADRPKRYASADFEVVENDLEPFFDNDTFPLENGFPREFIEKRQLSLTRKLEPQTEIKFFSRIHRLIAIELQFEPETRPAALSYHFDTDQPQNAVVEPDGRVILPLIPIARGLHKLVLGPLPKQARVKAFLIHPGGAGLNASFLKGQWYETSDLSPDLLTPFQFMSPRPSRFFSLFGPALEGKFYFAHSLTQLRFQVPAGQRRLSMSVRFAPEAYENLLENEATDGVLLEIAILAPAGKRTIAFVRKIDPRHVPADRGILSIATDLTVPANAEIEVRVGPGLKDNYNRDWFYLGPLMID
jgi:hypothetical protein